MDKRTLLFIISLALALFVVNFFFQKDHDSRMRTAQTQHEAIVQQREAKELADIARRTASPAELPIIPLFADPEGQKLVSTGVQVHDQILALAWSEELPATIYVQNGEQPKEASLKNSSDGAVIYSLEPGELDVAPLPQRGSEDLQFVNTLPTSEEPVRLGEVKDGRVSPIRSAAEQNAIVLRKVGRSYLPTGVFLAADDRFTPLSDIQAFVGDLIVVMPSELRTAQDIAEELYVIQTPFQQLVFSNYGGSLKEINLPFQSEENHLSVVKPIGFDRKIQQYQPQNDRFPLSSYYTPGGKPTGPFVYHEQGIEGGFYPLIRRSLIAEDPANSIHVPPQYYSLNITSKFPEVSELVYEVTHFDERSITFVAKQNRRTITKTYTLPENLEEAPYVIDLRLSVNGDRELLAGLWLNSGVPEIEWMNSRPSPALKYRITRNLKSETEKISLPKAGRIVQAGSVHPDWITTTNAFFGLIIDPLNEIGAGFQASQVSGFKVPSRLALIDSEFDRFPPGDLPGYKVELPLYSGGGEMRFRIFAGPLSTPILNQVDRTYTDPATGVGPDYRAAQTFHGYFKVISEPFAKFLMVLMTLFHSITGSWAFSIILLTVALRLLLYPLSAWSFRSMRRMQKIGPEVQAIQQKYKNNPRKAQTEVLALYRKKKANPFTGCIPMLIQMPFLIGMFDLLRSTFALRGACFIPGWIDNLTAPDVLFSWKTPIFFIGTEFHLLPFILGGVMLLQQRMTSTSPKDKSLWTDQQRQQRMMGNIMVVVFTVMFYNFPSGLNIYWISSMALNFLQQWVINRRLDRKEAEQKKRPEPVRKHKRARIAVR